MRPTRSRTNDPDGLRRRVLDAAARAFQAKGYASTSTHELMRLAGVSGGALHHHFPTKKTLALAVINERVAAEVGDTWIQTVREAPSAAKGIEKAFSTVIEALDRQRGIAGCPLGNLALELSLSDPDLQQALASQYQSWREAIVDRIRLDQGSGGASYAPDALAFANVVVALFSGAMTIAKAEQNTDALRACLRQLRAIMAAVPAGS